MSVNSKRWWAARLNTETKYASGSHADAYTQQKLSALSAMAYPRSYGKKMYPSQVPNRVKIESHDDDAMGSIEMDGGWKLSDGSREDYVQDSFYLDKVIAQLTSGLGTLPSSYTIHWQDHHKDTTPTPANDDLRYESYGCYVKSLSLSIPEVSGDEGGFPFWKIGDGCYSTKYDSGAGTTVDSLTKEPWLVIGSHPISTTGSFSIGGNEVHNIEGELAITLNYDDTIEAGDNGIKYPYFLGAEVEFTANFRSYSEYKGFVQNLLKAKGAESLYTIKINCGLAGCFPQITNMAVREGDFEQVEEKGMVHYEIVFRNTHESVLTKEAL